MLENYIKSIQPLLYEVNHEDYPKLTMEEYLEYELDKNRWIVTGTFFPVRFNEGIYFLTAKHCIQEESFLGKDPTKLTYGYPDELELIKANRTIVSRSIDTEGEAYRDLYAFYPDQGVDASKFAVFDLRIHPQITLDYFIKSNFPEDVFKDRLNKLYVAGYPLDGFCFDSESGDLKVQCIFVNGCSSVTRASETEIYSVVFDGLKITDEDELEKKDKYNGLSGSPVYYWDSSTGAVILLGMVVKYDYYFNCFKVIGVRALHEFLKAAELA